MDFELSVGVDTFEPGRTQVRVTGEGVVEVQNDLEGQCRMFNGRTDPEAVRRLTENAAHTLAGVTDAVEQRRGLPDEPLYELRIRRDDGTEQVATVWRGDAEKDPALSSLLAEARRLAAEVGDETIVV